MTLNRIPTTAICYFSGWVVSAMLAILSSGSFAAEGLGVTRSPIKHLIIIVGENRGFDHVFATYKPPSGQSVWNLLSKGIVNEDGSPGPHFDISKQLIATSSAKNGFELSPAISGTFDYLPQPSTTPIGFPLGMCWISQLQGSTAFCRNSGLDPSQEWLLSSLGTLQSFYSPDYSFLPAPDCRYPKNLPNGSYSMLGSSEIDGDCKKSNPNINSIINQLFKVNLPFPFPFPLVSYTSNTGDPVHRFYQMWQQSDCSIKYISADNPSGCKNDLYTWVGVTVGWGSWRPILDNYQETFQGGISMGFYNMAKNEWPYFRFLAQNYAISDNYHQPIMGGTGPNSQFMATGDVYYFTEKNSPSVPAKPIDELIENPNPTEFLGGIVDFYQNDYWNIYDPDPKVADFGNTGVTFTNCWDLSQPGVGAIMTYLRDLENANTNFTMFNKGNCKPNTYYQVNNSYPYYNTKGGEISDTQRKEFPSGKKYTVGPQTIPNIGDVLSQRGISWRYYGQSFDLAAGDPPLNKLYCAICNPFQFATSIMTTDLKNNLVDFSRFNNDISNGNLPAVSFVKPDLLVDGHPGSSTPPLFEAFVSNIVNAVKTNATLWSETAILITFDEAGGYYDSGYIQPIDFFGDGPRTPLIVVSPYAKGDYVDHTYNDHASILKFVEWNWSLGPLSNRSRDNLPNPVTSPTAPYFPINSPAIGDLRTLFNFTNNPAECLLNWAERKYPNEFVPAGSTTFFSSSNTYRYYATSKASLTISLVDNHVYYRNADGVLQDEGPLANWLSKAGCGTPVVPPMECLFNWAEQNYPNNFSPAGASTNTWNQYTYRYDAGTNTYLGASSLDNHVYYMGPDGEMQDEGDMYKWIALAGCQSPLR